jgi:RNA 2',3'-cyclic 3'-phosphodiesterase
VPRLFFAVQTPGVLVKVLDELQYKLNEQLRSFEPLPNLKTEKLRNSHCTVRFLGNVEESKIEGMIGAVNSELSRANIGAFETKLGTMGVFSRRQAARVMWIGLKPEAPFQHTQQMVDRALDECKILFERERPFHPHITLFRFREPYRLPDKFEFPDLSASSPTVLVSEMMLIQSKTLAKGPEHTVRAKFRL